MRGIQRNEEVERMANERERKEERKERKEKKGKRRESKKGKKAKERKKKRKQKREKGKKRESKKERRRPRATVRDLTRREKNTCSRPTTFTHIYFLSLPQVLLIVVELMISGTGITGIFRG